MFTLPFPRRRRNDGLVRKADGVDFAWLKVLPVHILRELAADDLLQVHDGSWHIPPAQHGWPPKPECALVGQLFLLRHVPVVVGHGNGGAGRAPLHAGSFRYYAADGG